MNLNKVVDGVVVPLTAAEIAERLAEEAAWVAGERDRKASAARTERNHLLAASDWTQVADAPVDQAAWAVYRQALRDVPKQAGFPKNVVWPTKPN